jgi:hypothetical protein
MDEENDSAHKKYKVFWVKARAHVRFKTQGFHVETVIREGHLENKGAARLNLARAILSDTARH